jgi:hypothetical protein
MVTGPNAASSCGYGKGMGMMSKVVKLGIAAKLVDAARKPENQQKAREAYEKFQANRQKKR